jgi:hypothetical protein
MILATILKCDKCGAVDPSVESLGADGGALCPAHLWDKSKEELDQRCASIQAAIKLQNESLAKAQLQLQSIGPRPAQPVSDPTLEACAEAING